MSGTAITEHASQELIATLVRDAFAANARKTVEDALVLHQLKFVDLLTPENKKLLAETLMKTATSAPAKQLTKNTALTATNKAAVQAAEKGMDEVVKKAAERSADALAKGTVREVSKTAGREIAKGIGRSGLIGGALEAAMASVTAVKRVNAGEWTAGQGTQHVARGTAMGVGAGVAATAAVAGVTVLLGPIGLVGAFFVGTLAGTGARQALDYALPGKIE